MSTFRFAIQDIRGFLPSRTTGRAHTLYLIHLIKVFNLITQRDLLLKFIENINLKLRKLMFLRDYVLKTVLIKISTSNLYLKKCKYIFIFHQGQEISSRVALSGKLLVIRNNHGGKNNKQIVLTYHSEADTCIKEK